jgi:ribosome-associated toxin RatA of RatAB toxin-antitoxin module
VIDAPPDAVFAVLTDYERIPEYLPEVRVSSVRVRESGRAVVEQEAAARALLFTKRVHLVLAIDEGLDVITFRDMCGRSFEQYDGEWRATAIGNGSSVWYTLRARPAFAVPAFVLRRLLHRDATGMIEQIAREVMARMAR